MRGATGFVRRAAPTSDAAETARPAAAEPAEVLRIETIRELEALAGHEAAWNALASTGLPARPMFSGAWVLPGLLARPASDRIEVSLAWRGERLVGVLPLMHRGALLRSIWVSLTDDHTYSGGPLLAPDEPPSTLEALLMAGGPRALRLEGLVRDGELARQLRDPGILRGWGAVHRETGVEGARLSTTRPFDELIAALTRKSRKNVRASERKLAALGDLQVDVRQNGEALERLDDFLAVEASGWKHADGTAIRDDDKLLSYYRDLATRMARAGWFELHLLRLDGTPIAGEFCVRFRGALYLQKIAYDEQYAKHSPGHVLWMKTIEAAAADPEIVAVDTIGTDLIRQRWQATPYEYENLLLYPPTLTGRIRHPLSRLRAYLAELRRRRRARSGASETSDAAE